MAESARLAAPGDHMSRKVSLPEGDIVEAGRWRACLFLDEIQLIQGCMGCMG
jgi:hypothetical protein